MVPTLDIGSWLGKEMCHSWLNTQDYSTCQTNQPEAIVEEMWVNAATGRGWGFSWRRQFFVWENNLLKNLL